MHLSPTSKLGYLSFNSIHLIYLQFPYFYENYFVKEKIPMFEIITYHLVFKILGTFINEAMNPSYFNYNT